MTFVLVAGTTAICAGGCVCMPTYCYLKHARKKLFLVPFDAPRPTPIVPKISAAR